MMDEQDDNNFNEVSSGVDLGAGEEVPEARRRLVQEICGKVKGAKTHHKKAFDRMREDMKWAKEGTSQKHFEGGKKYVANIIQRFLTSRIAKLYAKNPKAYYTKRPRREFQYWDGDMASIEAILQKFASGIMDPVDMQVIEDFKNGIALSKLYDGMGDTLVKTFNYYLLEQKPKFKTQMKQLVRRTLTCGVGYIKLGYQRELQRRSDSQAAIDDITLKLQNMQRMTARVQEGEMQTDDPEMEQLRLQMQQMMEDPSTMEVIREGLVFDFPKSTAIVVDPACTNLQGFVDASWIAHEIYLSADEVEEIYGVKLEKGKFTAYEKKANLQDGGYQTARDGSVNGDLNRMHACVWEFYNKKTGLVYTVCEGYYDFLEEPGVPNVEVEGFFPIYSLVFNGIEDEKEIYPKSDVRLMIHMQDEWNRSREGLREHRQAARPRYVAPRGSLEEQDKRVLRGTAAHEVAEILMGQNTKITDVIQQVPSAGVDPNLYDTSHLMQDLNIVVGAQESSMGGISGGTATEVADAASATMSTIESNIDDMDDFLTEIARDGGQILMLNCSSDRIREIVGAGAVWPESEMTRDKVAKELFLQIEAGSSGKANKAMEIANFEKINPSMLQMPGLNKQRWLKEGIRRLDDKLNPEEFMDDSMSVVAMNAMKIPSGGSPANIPEQQGINGGMNAPGANNEPVGSVAPMGANAPVQAPQAG